MKASLRIEARIEVYRDRIIIPRQIAEISESGLKLSYTATVINEEDTADVFSEDLQIDTQASDLDILIQEIKDGIDKAIAKREEFFEEQSRLPKTIFEVLEQALKIA